MNPTKEEMFFRSIKVGDFLTTSEKDFDFTNDKEDWLPNARNVKVRVITKEEKESEYLERYINVEFEDGQTATCYFSELSNLFVIPNTLMNSSGYEINIQGKYKL